MARSRSTATRIAGDAAAGLALAAGIAACGWVAHRRRARLPHLEPRDRTGGDAAIDVVVPARDEAETIAGCVMSLWAAGASRVVVVDDASSDPTARLATAAGAEVVTVKRLPAGHLGKPHACAAGAAKTGAPWIAFVDADVRLVPGALDALVEVCEREGLAAASPVLRRRGTDLSDRLAVPLALWERSVGLPPAHGAGGVGALSGQCLVVRRSAYEEAGGHAHPDVRGSVVEAWALARVLAAHGHHSALVLGEYGETAGYRGVAGLRADLGRNVAPLLGDDPPRGALVAAASSALTGVPLLAAATLLRPSWGRLLGVATAYAAGAVVLRDAYRSCGEPEELALLHPAAALLVQAVGIESLLRSLLGRQPEWKGRPLRVVDAA